MKKFALLGLMVTLFATPLLVAQEGLKFPEPQKEHEWLKQFIGSWEMDSKASMGPGQPDMECKGTMTSRALGGFWVVSDIKSDMMGNEMHGVQTLGYDAKTKKFVGTWVDSMMDHMWKYEGSVDKTGKILTLEAMGPNFLSDGKSAKFKDVYEFKSKDEFTMTSSMEGEDGKWVTFMSGTGKRTKK